MSQSEAGPASRHLWLILGLALLVRALAWVPGMTHPERFSTPDSVGYLLLARDLDAGYLDPQSNTFTLGLIRTPVYPFFLGALLRLAEGSLRAIVVVQIGIALGTVWLTYVLGRHLIGTRAAVAGSLLLALDPVSILFSCLFQPETLFTALLVAGTLGWFLALRSARWSLALVAGGLLGLAALTRPIGLFLPLYLATAVLTVKEVRPRRGVLICFLLAWMLPVGLWMAKNQVLTGFPIFSIAGSSSLLEFRAAGALAEDDGISLENARAKLRERLIAMGPAQSVAELSVKQRTLAFQVLSEHPKGVAKMMFGGVLRMMAGTGLTALSNLAGDPDPEGLVEPWKRGVQALQLLALGIAYAAVIRGLILLAVGRGYLAIALTLGVAVYFALFSAGPEANTRFRFPITPFLALLAGHGLTASVARSRKP